MDKGRFSATVKRLHRCVELNSPITARSEAFLQASCSHGKTSSVRRTKEGKKAAHLSGRFPLDRGFQLGFDSVLSNESDEHDHKNKIFFCLSVQSKKSRFLSST